VPHIREGLRASVNVGPGPACRSGVGDLVGAAGLGDQLGVAADLRGGRSPGLDGAGWLSRFAAHAEPIRVGASCGTEQQTRQLTVHVSVT
jgi:hypothetical protein